MCITTQPLLRRARGQRVFRIFINFSLLPGLHIFSYTYFYHYAFTFSFLLGSITLLRPALWAANTFSLIPPTYKQTDESHGEKEVQNCIHSCRFPLRHSKVAKFLGSVDPNVEFSHCPTVSRFDYRSLFGKVAREGTGTTSRQRRRKLSSCSFLISPQNEERKRTGRTRPLKVISPVMAVSERVHRPLERKNIKYKVSPVIQLQTGHRNLAKSRGNVTVWIT